MNFELCIQCKHIDKLMYWPSPIFFAIVKFIMTFHSISGIDLGCTCYILEENVRYSDVYRLNQVIIDSIQLYSVHALSLVKINVSFIFSENSLTTTHTKFNL